MGQAKIRSVEINEIKSKNVVSRANVGDDIKLIAIMHLRNGWKNVVSLDGKATHGNKTKDQLLKTICTECWLSSSVSQKIINYFSLTTSYEKFKRIGMFGFVVNFYENDKQCDGWYGCRNIVAVKTEKSFIEIMKFEIKKTAYIAIR